MHRNHCISVSYYYSVPHFHVLVTLGWAAGILIIPISLTGLFIALGSRQWGPRIKGRKQTLAASELFLPTLPKLGSWR